MASPEELRTGDTPEENPTPEVKPSSEVRESREGQDAKKEAKQSLENLKKDIQAGKMSFELTKTYLESLDGVHKEYRCFIIGGILSGLNQRGISIEGVKTGRITLKAGVQSLREKLNIATHEETLSYQHLLNNYLSSGKITIQELNKSLLYRTSSLDHFLQEQVDGKKMTTSQYAGRLIEKYKPNFEKYKIGDYKIVIDIKNEGVTIKKENFPDEQTFLAFRESVKNSITDNQADREFLLAFFDDIYYNNRKGIQENAIDEYKKSSKKIEGQIFTQLNTLSEEQKYALGIKSANDAEEIARKWKNNPLEAVKEAFSNGGGLLGIILGLIGAIFWGKRGFLGGFVAGMGIAGGGLAVAGDLLNNAGKKTPSGNTPGNQPSVGPSQNNPLYEKINFHSEADNTKKLELQRIWGELSKNEKFLGAPTTILTIFESTPTKPFEEIKTTLEAYGISLTEENKDYYKNIFSEIIKQRKAAGIGEPLPTENIQTYLTRSSGTTEAAVATGAVAGAAVVGTSGEKGNEIINSPYASTFTYRIVDGKTYLIGENGEYLLQNNTLNEAGKEVFKKYEKLGILNEILQIWIPHAERTSQSLLFKGIRSGTTVIPEAIKKINATFEQLFVKIQKGENIENDINMIWSEIEKAENANSIIGSSDMKKVKEIFNNQLDTKDQKLLKIYNTMRYGGWSGNSEGVKNQVAGHLLNQEGFKNIDDILKNPETFNLIKNNNKQKLKELVGEEIAMQILIAYGKIKIKQEKQREEYTKIVARINEVKKVNKEKEIHLNDYIDLNTEISVMELLKHSLITKQIFEMSSRGDEKTSYTGLYANIVGLAQNKGNDWAVISDDNIDNAIDISSTLAIAAVSMGVGALAARGTMAVARLGTRLPMAARLATGGGKIGTAARFAGASTLEGLAFYQGYNISNNIIYGNDLSQNAGNIKEIAKTVAFMGVLRGVGEVMGKATSLNKIHTVGPHSSLTKTGEALAFIGKMTDKVPAGVLKNTGEILVKGGLITTTSVGLDYVFEGEADWTWEEYLQAVMLAGVMKGVGKITFKKTNGSVTATETPSPQTTSILQKVRERVSSANIPETAKNHILDIAKAGALGGSAGTILEGGYNWYSGKFDEQTALQVTGDLISTFTKYAVIGGGLRTIYLGGVGTINGVKKLIPISHTPGTGGVIQSISGNKTLLGTTLIGGVAYNVYSD